MKTARAHDKWLTTDRLYTDSNSIRQKDLNNWNQGIRWIKLRAVSGKKDQLFVDLSATSEVKLENVWRMGLTMARRVVMALNVSTLGYFWFHRPPQPPPSEFEVAGLATSLRFGPHSASRRDDL